MATVVASHLTGLVRRIADRRPPRTEADLQGDIATLLQSGPFDLEDEHAVRREAPTADGTRRRIDIERGQTVFELKSDLRIGNARADGLTQLAGYMKVRADQSGHRYVGVLTDGAEWLLCSLRPDETVEVVSTFLLEAQRPDVAHLAAWLGAVLATSERVRPTPDTIEERLGADAPRSAVDLADLRAIYQAHRRDPHVQMKRELWGRLLTIALGTSFEETDELFIEHTYLVILAELMAHAVVGINITGFSGDALLSGKAFEQAKIGGVVERDFFDWPADTPDGERLVRDIARRVDRFEWAEVDHDVLKILYESVIDETTRKRLGEYYTPDWLAEKIVAETIGDPLNERVLDPACGSGTFLFWAIRRFLETCDRQGIKNSAAIDRLVGHVFGVDLHPVAVTLARVTYLLAIGRARLTDRNAFNVPVYLGDSVQWDDDRNTLLAEGGLRVYTTDGAELFDRVLHFPDQVLEDPARFDRLITDLADRASRRERGARPRPPIKAILNRHGVAHADRRTIETTYRQLCDLHDDGRNHIWGYYIRNVARPLWFTRDKVDVLIGNPPWLSYRFMPLNIRATFRDLATERGLWARAQVATNQDLSALFVARSCELYLRKNGRFGFVMPAAALTRQQFAGFRRGNYDTPTVRTSLAFDPAWNLSAIKPAIFPVPAAVIRGRRSDQATALPKLSQAWSGRLPDRRSPWAAVEQSLKGYDEGPDVAITEGIAVDVTDGPGSPYASDFKQGATVVPRVLTMVEAAPAGPLGVPKGHSYVRSARSIQEKEPWRSTPSLSGVIENQFLHRLLLGSNVLPFRTTSSIQAVIPWTEEGMLDTEAREEFPGLADWWTRAEAIWAKHKSGRSSMGLIDRLDYQRGVSAQFPPASHRVVYSASGTYLAAARLTGDALIEHKLYWTAVASLSEARYLTAILNSAALGERVTPLQSVGQFGPRDFDKYVFRIPFPRFNQRDSLHGRIVRAAARAEKISASAPLPEMVGFQKARSMIREALEARGVMQEIEAAVHELLAPPQPATDGGVEPSG
jgi:SAM-dependent methyltransferase